MTFSYSDIVRIAAGLLQLVVASYALRLSRLCKSGRLGWLLFSGLTLLALAYMLLPMNPFRSSIHLAAKADVIFGLISLLLIAAMVHLDLRFKKRLQDDEATRQAQSEWQSKVGEQIDELNRTNDELRQVAASLQTQLGDTTNTQMQTEQMSRELLTTSHRTEAELRHTITQLEGQIVQQREAQEQVERAHQEQLLAAQETAKAEAGKGIGAGLVPAANRLLGEAASARLAAAQLARSRLGALSRAAKLLSTYARELGSLCKGNPRGQRLQQNLARFAQHWAGEQGQLVRRIDALSGKVERLSNTTRQLLDQIAILAGTNADPAAIGEMIEVDRKPDQADLEPHFFTTPTETATDTVFLVAENPAGEADATTHEEGADAERPAEVPTYFDGGRVA